MADKLSDEQIAEWLGDVMGKPWLNKTQYIAHKAYRAGQEAMRSAAMVAACGQNYWEADEIATHIGALPISEE